MTFKLPAVIGIYAPRPQSGKSTVTDWLIDTFGPRKGIRFVRVKLTEPLKDPLYAIGLTEEEVEGALKDKPCAKLGGKIPRDVMIDFYKQGAALFGAGWLTEIARYKVQKLSAEGAVVLIDDVRRPTDYAMVRDFASGIVWRIERPAYGDQPAGGVERIEGELEGYFFHADIRNDGTLADLRTKAEQALLPFILADT